MRKYKANYTEEFRDKQIAWFEERMERLPQSLQISDSTSTSDLPRSVRSLIQTLRMNKPSVTFSGYMETLLKIKDRLQEQGLD